MMLKMVLVLYKTTCMHNRISNQCIIYVLKYFDDLIAREIS